jgi:hypothetical protein
MVQRQCSIMIRAPHQRVSCIREHREAPERPQNREFVHRLFVNKHAASNGVAFSYSAINTFWLYDENACA